MNRQRWFLGLGLMLLVMVAPVSAVQESWQHHLAAADLEMRYADIDDPVNPVSHLEKAMALAKREAASPTEIAHLYARLGLAYESARQTEEAEKTLLEGKIYIERSLGKDAPAVVPVLRQLAGLRWSQKRVHEMLGLYADAVNVQVKNFGPVSPEVVEGYSLLGLAFNSAGESAEAEKWLRRSVDVLHQIQSPSDELVGNTTLALADFLDKSGKTEEAMTLRGEGRPALDRFLSKERELTKALKIDALRRPTPPQ